jgi:hypothetical protein
MLPCAGMVGCVEALGGVDEAADCRAWSCHAGISGHNLPRLKSC